MTTQEAYARGFSKTAAAAGLNPDQLYKYAFKSTPLSEWGMSTLGSTALPVLAPVFGMANGAGELMGLLTDDETQKNQDDAYMNLIPGVSGYRRGNRIKSQLRKQQRNFGTGSAADVVSEILGPAGNVLLSGLAGAGIGAGAGYLLGGIPGWSRGAGAEMGAAAGSNIGVGVSVLASAIGAISAAIARRRTAQEQAEHDRGSSGMWANYLLPGAATYNRFKRVGRSQGDRDEDEEAEAKKKEKANA